MSAFWLGLFWVLGAGIVAGGGAYLLHRYAKSEQTGDSNDTVGVIFAGVGVLYGVVLAFVLIAVWESVGAAQENTYREANAIQEVYWASMSLPEDKRGQVQSLCRDYLDTVVNDEFPAMRDQQAPGPEGWQLLDLLRTSVIELEPTDAREETFVADATEQLRTAAEARQQRIAAARQGISGVMWLVLIAGGVVSSAFALLFGVPGKFAHIAVAAGLAATTAMVLFAVYQLEYPFSRGYTVGPFAFELALSRINQG